MSRPVTVACLQTRPMPDFETALAEALSLAEQAVADGADLLALPEYCGGLLSSEGRFAPPAAEEDSHLVVQGLREFAARHSVDVLIGSVAVTGQGQKYRNRSLYVDKSGEVLGRYDKIHLFDVNLSATEQYRESDSVEPGGDCVTVDSRFGRVGLSVCYDLRFAHLYRLQSQNGAEILMIPAAFAATTGRAHWHILQRARAIENGAFVVAPCAVGPVDGGGEAYGHSVIVEPWGTVLADGGTEAGVVIAQIDLDLVAETRARVPSLSHDRPYSVPGRKRAVA
ncbi:MAG: carbon-nitrogen hydrolase family protein [Pseudomonadota bacterium]